MVCWLENFCYFWWESVTINTTKTGFESLIKLTREKVSRDLVGDHHSLLPVSQSHEMKTSPGEVTGNLPRPPGSTLSGTL